ncbi:MAG: carbohydrate ABC transporter permease [Anaerolineaceae bacterium]|nr:carbohydrate ABC transporter permease [Anaerolineaceae bacterium]
MMRQPSNRGVLRKVVLYNVMIVISIIFMIPLLWMISTSLKTQFEVFTWPPQFIPSVAHWENYKIALTKYPFLRYTMNSVILVILNILGELISVPLIAYGFARLRFKFKNVLFILMIATMILPLQIKIIPLYVLYSKLAWTNTYLPLVIPSLFGSPFFIFLMVQYMKTIPRDLDDAAKIDGAGTLTILYRIILPLCKPALTVIVIYTFLWIWNGFLEPLIYLKDSSKYTVQLGLQMFQGYSGVEWNLFMAATLVTILPILILYFFVQKSLIGGIASVGIKG